MIVIEGEMIFQLVDHQQNVSSNSDNQLIV